MFAAYSSAWAENEAAATSNAPDATLMLNPCIVRVPSQMRLRTVCKPSSLNHRVGFQFCQHRFIPTEIFASIF